MKQNLPLLFLIFSCLIGKVTYAQISADDSGCISSTDSWTPAGSISGHNTYQTTLNSSGAPCRIQWSVSNNRWEIIAAVEADGVFNDLLYYNSTNTSPNPPALSVGGWTDSGFGCGPLTKFEGPYTSTTAPDNVAPVVTDVNISISGATGIGGAYKIGDTITATWNNSASGDNNTDIASVTINFSLFGGGTAVAATNSGGIWTATYTITPGDGNIDGIYCNVAVKATDLSGNSTTQYDDTFAVADNIAPGVSDEFISISGASGTGGAFKIGNTVTVTWNNGHYLNGGQGNGDVISSVTVNFSQFGGGTAVTATKSGDIWTATYTITAGSIDATSRNVSLTVTDNAGNSKTAADGTNATVDNIAPVVTDARISISGATGTGGAYKIGDTVTAIWNNTAGGDNNGDPVSATVNFSQFGGGLAVAATNSSNTWTATYTITAGTISATNRNVSVTATDNAGNATTRADGINATVDNTAPAITGVNVPTDDTYGIGAELSFQLIFSENIIVDANGGAPRLALSLGNGIVYAENVTSSVSNRLNFSYTVKSGDVDLNGITINALEANGGTIKDANGNNALLTLNNVQSTANVLVDGIAPTTTVNLVSLSNDNGVSSSDLITNVASQIISGTLSANLAAGEQVFVSLTGVIYYPATAAAGSNTFSIPFNLTGNSTIYVYVRDAVGNQGTIFSKAYTLDTTAPTTTVATMSLSNDTGIDNSDFITNVAAQTVSGTLSANLLTGERLLISFDNGSTFSNATASAGSNTWSKSVTLAGNNTIIAVIEDAAGNRSSSFSKAYVLDATAPATTVSTATFSADSGPSATDFITKTAAQTISGTLSANLVSGERVMFSLNNGNSYAVALAVAGSSSWLINETIVSGSNTFKVVVEDAAGNRGTVFSQAYTLDTTAPATTVSSTVGASGANTGTSPVPFTVTFSESVSGFAEADISVNNGTIANLSGTGTTYSFNVIPSTNGNINVNIAAGATYDAAGNTNIAASQFSINYQQPLPVSLIVFTAKIDGNATKLQWSTASESNNKFFSILRSGNGKDFVELTKVDGQKTTQNRNTYFYQDKSPLNGNNYYKLLQQDINGTVTELGIRAVNFAIQAKSALTLAPNPAISDVNIYFPQGTYKIEIIDASGQLVQAVTTDRSATAYPYAVSGIKAGLYVVRSFGTYGLLTTKLIKQ